MPYMLSQRLNLNFARSFVFAVGLCTALGPAFAAKSSTPPGDTLLVMNKPGTNVNYFRERLKKRGLVIVRELRCKKDAYSVFEVRPTASSAKVALQGLKAAAAQTGDVDLEAAEIKFKSTFQQCVPSINDPEYSTQWYLQSIKYSEMRCILDAFSKVQNKPRITMIDSGVDPINGELVDLQQFNFVGGQNGVSEAPVDLTSNNHGTGTSGVAAATTNNATNVASPASHDKATSITMCRTSDGVTVDTTDVLNAMLWCVDNQSTRGGPSVINLSVNAVPPATYNASTVVQAIAKSAASQGDLFVNAAGNTNDLDASKANKNFRVVVGIDENDMRWVDTSVNPVRGSVFGKFKAAAPASNILHLVQNSAPVTGTSSGTSLSAPIWSGSIAMLMSFIPTLTAPKADKLLMSTGTKTPEQYVKPNLYQAVIKGLKLKP